MNYIIHDTGKEPGGIRRVLFEGRTVVRFLINNFLF